MYIGYKNKNDEDKIHIAQVLTSEWDINSLYIDIQPLGSLVERELDYKQLHIDSVYPKDITVISDSVKGVEQFYVQHFM